jgi:hypothetical protein
MATMLRPGNPATARKALLRMGIIESIAEKRGNQG